MQIMLVLNNLRGGIITCMGIILLPDRKRTCKPAYRQHTHSTSVIHTVDTREPRRDRPKQQRDRPNQQSQVDIKQCRGGEGKKRQWPWRVTSDKGHEGHGGSQGP